MPGRRGLFCAIGFALAAFLLRLYAEPPDHGYTRYATIAYQMVKSGDWIAPSLDAHLYVDKPPLAIWLIAAPMALASSPANLFQHAPNLVAVALSVLFLRRLGARVFGRRDAGWLAAGIYLSMLLPCALLRDKRIDPLFAALLLGALDFLHAALSLRVASRARLARWLAAAVLLALATLTKGPLALLFFVVIAVAYAAWTRRLADLATREVLAALLLVLALVALWPLAMMHDVGAAAWIARVGERRMVSRFAGPLHYLGMLPLRLMPWTLLLPAFALAWRPLFRGAPGAALRFPVTWFGVIFVLLHLTSAKHSRYLLPALPAIALLFVAGWIDAGSGAVAVLATRARRWRDGAIVALLGLGALAGLALPLALIFQPTTRAIWLLLLLGSACSIAIPLAGLRLQRAGGAPVAVLAHAVVAVLLLQADFDLLRAARFLANDEFAASRAALAAIPPDAPLVTLGVGGDPRNALVLAAGRGAREEPDAAAAPRFVRETGGGFVVARSDTLAALRSDPRLAVGDAVPLRLAGRSLVLASLRPGTPP